MKDVINNINAWFGGITPAIVRYRWLIIVAILIITGVQGLGLSRLQFLNSNDSWLLEDDPLRKTKREFESIFGNDEYVIVHMEGDNVFSHEALVINRALGKALEREVPLAKDIFSLTDMDFTRANEAGIEVDDLVPEEIPESEQELEAIRQLAMDKEYLVDRLFSRDGTATIIAVELKPYPEKDGNQEDLEYQIRIAEKTREIIGREEFAGFDYRLGGVPVMIEGEMRWAAHEMESIMGTTLLVMAVLLAFFFRSVTAVCVPLLTASFSMIIVLGFFGWLGIAIQELVLIIPLLLVLVLGVGYNVHVLSFYRQKLLATGSRVESIRFALEHSAWPILFTVVTTAIGVLSFVIVPIESLRFAGIASAGLLLVCYPLVILMTPAFLSIGKDREPQPEAKRSERIEKGLEWLAACVEANKAMIIVVFLIVTIIFAAAIPSIDVDTDFTRTMGEEVQYIAEGMYIARSIGSLYNYEVAFDFGQPDLAKQPENLKKIDALGKELEQFDTFKRSNSINDIIKDLNETMQEGREVFHRIPEDPQLLAQLLLLYEMSGGTETEDWIDYEYQRARLQVELDSFQSQDVESQLEFIQQRAEEIVPDGKVMISGLAAIFAKVVNYVVNGQILSILLALGVVAVVMMIVFGNVKLGLIGMIPNISPVIVSLGVMSMAGTPLHMMTMMVAPMIIGIAVDDTIHFISHFRREFWATGSYSQANRRTFRSVGKAVLLTSVIICLGFAAFLPSQLLAYHHIGLYTIIAVLTALAADYFVTPVLIFWTKPFGKGKS